MTVKMKKGKVVLEGQLVTGEQNDTVGLVVWAASQGANINQTVVGGKYLPMLPAVEGDHESIVIPVGSLLTIEKDLGEPFALFTDVSDGWEEVV